MSKHLLRKRYLARTGWFMSAEGEEGEETETVEETEAKVVEEVFEYEVPEDLTSEAFDVRAAYAVAVAAFKAEHAKGADASLEVVNQIADDIEAFKAEIDRRDKLVADTQAAIAERAQKIGVSLVEDPEGDEEEAEASADTEEADGTEGDEAEAVEATTEEDAEDVEEPEALAASAKPGPRSFIRTRPRPVQAKPPQTQELPGDDRDAADPMGWSLVAAGGADLKEGALAQGSRSTLLDIATDARDSMTSPLSKRTTGNTHYLAQFQLNAGDAYTLTHDEGHNRAIDSALDEHVPAPTAADFSLDDHGALVAGAACGIVEEDFSVYDDSAVGRLWTLPTRVVPRGALTQWEPSSTLCDIIDRLADNISFDEDTVKVEVESDCPVPMPTVETAARYLIMRFNNFRRRSAPETYETEIRKHLAAHQINTHLDHVHTVLQDPTTEVRDLTGELAYVGSTEKDLWTILSVQAQGLRNEYCVDHDYALDATVPRWLRPALNAATAREFGVKADSVTEAMISMMFAEHAGARVQYIDWWQRLDKADNQFPGWFDMMLMPANSWLNLTQGTLNLGNEIRDTVSNANNQYTSFTEDFYTTARRKYGVRLLRVPLLVTGARPAEVENPPSAVPGVDSTVRPGFAL